MIQVAPNRSQNGLIALAVLGVMGILFLATYRPLPAEPVATAGPTQVAEASGTRSPAPSPTRSFLPVPTLKPTPTVGPCQLPSSLPSGATSSAVPKVLGHAGSILFASPVYLPAIPNPIAADDPGREWNMGLWFVRGPGAEPDLVAAAGRGMVIPLALAANGGRAAVWWWPERRGPSAMPCQQGIYELQLPSGSSRLVVSGDWAAGDDEEATWDAPTQARFRLPQVSFSADGNHLAVVDGDVIDLYDSNAPGVAIHHAGSCPVWAWAPTETRFVAGCEDMTSSWIVEPICCDGELGRRSIPIPAAPLPADFGSEWEQSSSRAMGFTADGDLRITRIYGFATGCEGPDPCHIPSPAWGMTTIGRATGTAVHELHETSYLFDYGALLSADASWLYGRSYDADEGAFTIDLGAHVVRKAPFLGTFAGAALDGSELYGLVENEGGGGTVRAVTPGSMTELATINWPDGAITQTPGIPLLGLFVAAALP